MKIFLTSMGFLGVRDENGNKTDCNLNPKNNFIKNLFNSIKKFDSFVFVCNDFTTYEENDNSAKLNFDALKKENFNFKALTVLDNRTKNNTQEIMQNVS